MLVTINGQTEDLSSLTVAELLAARGLDPRTVVVELNGRIPPREEWSNLLLHERDRLEILHILGGG